MSSEFASNETTPLRHTENSNGSTAPTTTTATTTRLYNNHHHNSNNSNIQIENNYNSSVVDSGGGGGGGSSNNLNLVNNNNNLTRLTSHHNNQLQHHNYSNNNIINNNNNNNQIIHQDQDLRNMDRNRQIIWKVTLDFLILLCVGLPILLFYLFGEPYKRGFFCDDESLRHPFHESTVKNYMLYLIGLVLPIWIILTTEFFHARSDKTESFRFMEWDVPAWMIGSFRQIGVFGFGAASQQLIVDIAKYSIGRLRPHFFDVCQPIFPDGTNCENATNLNRYFEEFTCTAGNSTPRMLKEMRLSFPSGHSSFSSFTMVYCAIYLHSRMNWRGSKLLKHFLQFLLVALAWFTSLSRISDYKHHWSDVLSGAVIGVISALIVSQFVSDLFQQKHKKSFYLPQTRQEMTTTITTSQPQQTQYQLHHHQQQHQQQQHHHQQQHNQHHNSNTNGHGHA